MPKPLGSGIYKKGGQKPFGSGIYKKGGPKPFGSGPRDPLPCDRILELQIGTNTKGPFLLW